MANALDQDWTHSRIAISNSKFATLIHSPAPNSTIFASYAAKCASDRYLNKSLMALDLIRWSEYLRGEVLAKYAGSPDIELPLV